VVKTQTLDRGSCTKIDGFVRSPSQKTPYGTIEIRRQIMRVTCDGCGCDMKITSSFRYLCPDCKNEIEMAHIQDTNAKYRDEHKKNIEWAKIKGNKIIIVE
jgi:hypothetical protein